MGEIQVVVYFAIYFYQKENEIRGRDSGNIPRLNIGIYGLESDSQRDKTMRDK